jgi:ribosomal protein S18
MTTQWNDFLIRVKSTDNGQIPRNIDWFSPDIIAAGQAPIADPTAVYGTADSYKTDPSVDIVYNATNYFYVRTRNLENGRNAGTAFLYYSDSQLLNYPSNWTPIGNPNGLEISASDLAQIVTPGKAFVWEKTPPQPANFHYCLVAWIKTALHSNKPDFNNVKTLAEFISQNGNWSQRNVTIVSKNSPSFVKSVNYNQGTEAAYMNFSITWTTPPVGSAVQLVARDPINGVILDSGRQEITKANLGFLFRPIEIPAGFKTVFDINYWANGHQGGDEFKFTFNGYYFVPPTESRLISFGKDMRGHGLDDLPVIECDDRGFPARTAKDIGPQPAILVGTQIVKTAAA